MKRCPETLNAPVLRTDFSDLAAWDAIRKEVMQPVDGFYANVDFIDDPDFADIGNDDLMTRISRGMRHSFIVVADKKSMQGEHLLLVMDLLREQGRQFRAEPSQIQSIENNLSISNMDFAEFAENCDPEGVFRGFPTF
ncbi:MAG: DUF6924 domain-containing protein [Thermoanaerobaculia bacterium]